MSVKYSHDSWHNSKCSIRVASLIVFKSFLSSCSKVTKFTKELLCARSYLLQECLTSVYKAGVILIPILWVRKLGVNKQVDKMEELIELLSIRLQIHMFYVSQQCQESAIQFIHWMIEISMTSFSSLACGSYPMMEDKNKWIFEFTFIILG